MTDFKSTDGAGYFVNTYADMILRICFTYSLGKSDAQDICQEIYIKLFKGNYRFKTQEMEKAFIAKSAANKCKDILKSGWFKRKRNLDELTDIPDSSGYDIELKSAVEKRPIKYKEVVYFYYYEGYDINETAEIMGCSTGCIKKRLSRARKMLRKIVEVPYETV